ncbi:hypothetical protein QYE76_059100 [Lolium multiflorum]|uniref:Retrotransposon gag domain-containing protein n=1 Tax=Lolium multiflorum TaxID=4521 RepID=A0AAD8T7Z8_LOLMU|nr:hypothetical protein QYE76_059100 [Lolium multiflorum]
MADGTPVTYEDLTDELKKKYDEIKVILEADLIGSFHRTRSHGIRWKGFSPNGALDGIDLSAPSEERTRSLRQEINYLVAHSLHRHSENLVNTLERVALRVIQEIMRHQYSPSGPALGTHQGELPLQSRPPLPYALAAPEVPASPAFVVYKIGGDPSDYQFLPEAPKEIPHGYTCTYVPDCGNWALTNQATTSGTSGKTGGTSATELEKQTWLTKYATPTNLQSSAPAVGSELEKQTWLAKYATPANLQSSTPAASTADQISTILRDQFGMVPKRRAIGYSKPYPDDYEMIPLPPKYRLPDFSKFSGSDGSSSIEHVGRYLAQLGPASVSDQLRVRLFSQSLTGSAFGWYTSLPPDSIRTWKQLEEQFHMQYHSEASESGIADLAQLRQKRGETVTEYIQRFRNLRNRCYSKLSAYEQRHPDLYQDKFKRAVVLVDAEEDEVPAGDQEVAVAEWTRGGTPVSCKWVKPPGPPRGFDFDVTKTEQIFDLLLKEKQLTIPEGLKFPTVQELNGKPYCKWHNSLSHATNDCRVWRQHIQAAIEKGRLIFNQLPARILVQHQHGRTGNHSGKDGDEGSCSRSKDTEEAAPRDRLRHDGKRYVTEGEVKNMRYQRPLSDHLLNKYVSQYDQRRRSSDDDERDRLAREARRHRRHDRDEEEHERRATEKSREQDDNDRHWDCPFFRHCWDSGMSRLPTIGNCPECNQKKKEAANVSVFKRLGPLPPQSKRAESPRWADLEDSEDEGQEEEEDRYHRPRWCPDGLSRSQKRRVQRLRGLEEAERLYLHTLRKARPDLAAKVQRTLDEEGRPRKMEWRPKQRKADDETSAGTNMVFILPSEFSAPGLDEAPVAQLDCGPRPVIFEKPRERSYRHLKALYLRGYIDGRPVNKMLVDTGAAVNIMPYSMLRRLGRSSSDLIKTNVTLSDFNGQASDAQGVLNVDLTVGRKTIPTTFFIVDSTSTYAVLLGRDWIHANCCIPSTMHQCIIQWDGDEVEVVQADDSAEISTAGMNAWEAAGQEPLSGINLDDCERIDVTKGRVKLVLSTGLTM